ncbi:MAG: hypothetical protein J6Q72_00265 [Clostridia bacterium]|nr:hypothetical protein [Clostridia bacterium]
MSKKALRILSLVLILLGIICCIVLITAQFLHCYEVVNTEFKGKEYTVFSYFLEVSKGAILLSVTVGIIFISAGIFSYVRSKKA